LQLYGSLQENLKRMIEKSTSVITSVLRNTPPVGAATSQEWPSGMLRGLESIEAALWCVRRVSYLCTSVGGAGGWAIHNGNASFAQTFQPP
jgi:hypothetical protein